MTRLSAIHLSFLHMWLCKIFIRNVYTVPLSGRLKSLAVCKYYLLLTPFMCAYYLLW
ncbi:hypothetical protein V8C35DRAFT_300297 [Trichoderma chlorosporum]